MKLTQERLKECLNYNPDTGEIVWLFNKGMSVKGGDVAGTPCGNGYRHIMIDGVRYLSHRLAFLYMTGEVPETCDHINRIKDDNRWCNLRPATHRENMRNRRVGKNNSSGYHGVSYDNTVGKYRAQIRNEGKKVHIGYFTCKHHAFCEYVLASRKYFGEFSAV